jgi:hypothetical protein
LGEGGEEFGSYCAAGRFAGDQFWCVEEGAEGAVSRKEYLPSKCPRIGVGEENADCGDSQAFMAMGGNFTLSDDSHGVAQVGLNFGRVSDYLKSLGVRELCHLERQAHDLGTESKLPLVVKKMPFMGLDGECFPYSVLN